MHGDLERVLPDLHAGRGFGISARVPVAPHERLELGKLQLASRLLVFRLQLAKNAFQQNSRPTLFVNAIRTQILGRLMKIAHFWIKPVPTDRPLSPAAFLRAKLIPFIGEEMLERSEQEGTEPSTFRVGPFEVIAFEKAGEKLLGQILGVLRPPAQPPHMDIERIPIGAAQGREGCRSLWRVALAGLKHYTPVRGG